MENITLWVFFLIAICIVGFGMFVLGTRSGVNTSGKCEVDVHWWFGWWVRCHEDCILQWRKKDSEENWSDAGVIPGGSVKWSEHMEYRCSCS